VFFRHIYLSLFLISFFSSYAASFPYETAVIIGPVIDMNNSFPAPNNPCASPESKPCPRAHQGLYNEIVYCVEEYDDQSKICCPGIIYGYDADQKSLNSFWTYSKHIRKCKDLSSKVLQSIPHHEYGHESSIVLTYPYNEFSVGTRFKRLPSYDTDTAYAIVRADYGNSQVISDFIPRENAIIETKNNHQVARKLFVKIINDILDKVTHSNFNQVIGYVWGGSSFVHTYVAQNFYEQDGTWHRRGIKDPYSGYDCSELVWRMARIAGLYFPWKNTKTIEQSCKQLASKDQLEEGDLIWMPGHVMIISSIERNEIIEARGYANGYGCVHRLKLNECFEDIETYQELLNYYFEQKSVMLKDKIGRTTKKVFKILKVVSDVF
jgi:hypothetical protein